MEKSLVGLISTSSPSGCAHVHVWAGLRFLWLEFLVISGEKPSKRLIWIQILQPRFWINEKRNSLKKSVSESGFLFLGFVLLCRSVGNVLPSPPDRPGAGCHLPSKGIWWSSPILHLRRRRRPRPEVTESSPSEAQHLSDGGSGDIKDIRAELPGN